MRNTITLLNKRTGQTVTGYTVKLYSYSEVSSTSSDPGSYTAKYTLTDGNNGTYYTDVTTTMRGSVVLVTPASTTIIPPNLIGHLFQGDNQLTIPATT